jgi:surface carbohydrate biosynthesis protein
MNDKTVHLLLPIENQVRELDPRLLLACIAAKRGFPSVIGPLREIEFHIVSFPRSIYLSKSMLSGRIEIFKSMRLLGHEIVTLDEEALVHLPPEIYYSRRLNPKAIKYVSQLFAWGNDNAELWRHYPLLPADAIINITGNPRTDMLRPEIRDFYEEEVKRLRSNYGEFILVNTNFNHVNAYYANMNLFQPVKNQGEKSKFGRAAKGMTREYAEGLWNHKQAVFENFQQLIPTLAAVFPDYNIVVRPHPTENNKIYHKIAARCTRVQVTNEGNVVPWLMAARALIHNGCTTGVEAYALGLPAISYRASIDEEYDYGFYRLPNMLSHQCFNLDQLQETLGKVLAGELGTKNDDQCKALIDRYLAAQDGPLACERMVDVLEQMLKDRSELPKPSLRKRLEGRYRAIRRRLKKQYKSYHRDSHLKPEFQRHRYPKISSAEVRMRIARFQQILGDHKELKIQLISNKFFRIST